MDNFENIQLYRTNVLLGGNMKYDLVLDDNGESLLVKDFHITHITGNKPFNYDDTKYLLDNTHQKNILEYYNANINNFYKDHVDPKLSSNYPVMYDEYNITKCYDDNWFMGLKRAPRYNKYQKQFEFFVPLWIEKIDDLIFEISLYSNGNKLSTKSLTLSPTYNNLYSQSHNDFCKYLYDYMKSIGIAQDNENILKIDEGSSGFEVEDKTYGSNDVFSINFTDYAAYIHGLNILSGSTETLFLNNKCYELLEREIPFPDFNMKITESFKDNVFISKQLFNFNLCFNIQDISAPQFKKILTYSDINVKVSVKNKNKDGVKYFAHKDFYTNYQYIPKKNPVKLKLENNKLDFETSSKSNNVLDFLKEYNCVDYINYNKITQQNHMWSLVKDYGYIFNLYEGFAGNITYDKSDNEYVNINNQGLAFDPTRKQYDKYINNEYWCNIVNCDDVDMNFLKYYKSHISELYQFCSNVKNMYNDIIFDTTEDNYMLFVLVPTGSSTSLDTVIKNNTYHVLHNSKDFGTEEKKIYHKKLFNINIFATCHKELLTYNNIHSILNDLLKVSTIPKCISFSKSVNMKSTGNDEYFEYVLNDNYNFYLNRYDGQIKPTFISINDKQYKNELWAKKLIEIGTVADPYKSNYTPYEERMLEYDKNVFIEDNDEELSNHSKYKYLGNTHEYCWFNNSNFTLLPTDIYQEYYSSKLSTPYTIALEYLSTIITDDYYKIYIKSQYDEEDKISVSLKVANIIQLYDINVEFVQNKYEVISNDDKILYKDTYTLEVFEEEKDVDYKYYKIQLKLK